MKAFDESRTGDDPRRLSRGGTMRLVILALAIGGALSLGATVARADVMIDAVTPTSITTTIDCSGEVVAFEGTTHTLLTQTVDAHGGVHVRGQVEEHLFGVGLTSGDRYVWNALETVGYRNFDDVGNATLVEIAHVNHVGESTAADDHQLHYLEHFTLTPGGAEPVVIDRYREDCG
jgi:hypothetical protein